MLHGFSCIPSWGIFARPRGFRMTDLRFYLLLTLVVLALAASEVVYAMVGLSQSPRTKSTSSAASTACGEPFRYGLAFVLAVDHQ
jgi:hypothetical protein